jgi:hypothetical protein
MGAALQVLNFYSTSLSGGGFEALTAGSGDSATFQNVPGDPAGWLSEIWGLDDTNVCELSFTASRFHDQTYGIRVELPDGGTLAPANRPSAVSPVGFDQPIYPSDVLSVKASGTASDNVNVTFVLYYPNLPGVDFHGVTAEYVRANGGNHVGVYVNPTSGSGDWGTSVVLNSSTDLLHAGKQYAVMGVTSQTPVAAFGLQGIDTGNLRVGGPILGDPGIDAYMFSRLAEAHNAPLIPVIQANNAGAINIYLAHTTGASTKISVYLIELKTNPIG